MKKLFSMQVSLAVSLILSSFCVHANDYLQIRFSSNAVIASKVASGDSLLLDFNDPNLDNVFSSYKIVVYTKDFPSASRLTGPYTDTLLRVYRISTTGNLQNLFNQVSSTNSSDLDNVYITHDPELLYEPNDYYNNFTLQTDAFQHLDLVNAKSAWDVTRGLSCIKVGISDEYFITHTELNNKATAATGVTVITSPGGYWYSGSYVVGAHGAAVAGLVGGETDNNTGISSLGNIVKMRYYNIDYNAWIDAAVDGCKVINASWWDGTSSVILTTPNANIQSLIDGVYNSGVTIVVAAGNNNTGTPTDYLYPASYNHVISVSSVGSQYAIGTNTTNPPGQFNWKDCHRRFSDPTSPYYDQTYQHNTRVDICAPGHYVSILAYDNTYNDGGGTSFSAPLVSAAAALLYSLNPNFTPDQIKGYLKNNASTAMFSNGQNNAFTGLLGSGRLDAGAALNAAVNSGCQVPLTGVIWSAIKRGAMVTINPYECWDYNEVFFTPASLPAPGQTVYWEFRYYDGSTWHSIFKTNTSTSLSFGDVNSSAEIKYTSSPRAPLQCLNNLEVYVRQGNEAACCVSAFTKAESGSSFDCQTIKSTNVYASKTSIPLIENLTKDNLTLFPSPATNEINISCNIESEKTLSYDLYDNQGKKVKSGIIQHSPSAINISNLSKGLYILRLNGREILYRKFIKQ